MTARPILGAVLLVLAVAACGSDDSRTGSSAATTPATEQLDSIVALGHSGLTGFNADPAERQADAREYSWATGDDPAVTSIYQRLLATRPALRGNATNLAVDGSTVDDLPAQVDQMLALDPLPDVVIIQSIDNDMQCDGTDPDNELRYAAALDAVLTTINQDDPGAHIFFVDQWAAVQTYVDATKDLPASVAGATGDGPCDTFTATGEVRAAGVASQQQIVDDYFAAITRVCAAHQGCFTDGGALQRMPLTAGDLTSDADHLSVSGLTVMAQYAWEALPAAITNRP